MADNKKWFKVWTAILADDDFDSQRPGTLENIGRFALLGAYTALQGEAGRVEVMPDTLYRMLQVQNLDELKSVLLLKNVHFEEGKNRYGKIIVTWNKWKKYQEDSTAAERMKALRSKKRREEKREEEKRNTPLPPHGEDGDFDTGKTDKDRNPHIQFVEYAFKKFKEKTGEKLFFHGKKDGAIVKKLLSTYGLEKLKELWDVFMQSDDQFIRKAGYSIGVFSTQINKLVCTRKASTTKPQVVL